MINRAWIGLTLLIVMAPLCFSEGDVVPNIDVGEQQTFRVCPDKGAPFLSVNRYERRGGLGPQSLSYTSQNDFETWDVVTDLHGYPSGITYTAGQNVAHLIFDGHGGVTEDALWNGRKVSTTARFSGNVTLEIALVLRTLDLGSAERQLVLVLQRDRLPELVAFPMYFQVVSEETISVPAGSFPCKKVLFSLTDWRGAFYKAYLYVSNDEHRYWVKSENMPTGGFTELVSISRK